MPHAVAGPRATDGARRGNSQVTQATQTVIHTTQHENQGEEDVMTASQRQTMWIVLALLVVGVAVIVTIVTVNAKNKAAEQEQQRQQEHSANVSWYTDHCNVNGSWVC